MGGRADQRTGQQITAKDAAAWRAWLRVNHRQNGPVWLVFFKKHTGVPCPSYDEAVREALCWGWIDSIKKRIDDERYAFKFTPRRSGSKWSPSNKRRVAELQAAGRMMPAGQALIDAAKADGSWDRPTAADLSATPPPELTGLLAQNAGARRAFEALPPSHRRRYALWVRDAKRAETRQRRAAKAIAMLGRGERLAGV